MHDITDTQLRVDEYPDRVAYLKDGWAVRFNGCIEGARWADEGAALAHLALLQSGQRDPQPERTFAPKHEYRCGVCFGLGSIPLANRLDRCDSCEGTGKVLR